MNASVPFRDWAEQQAVTGFLQHEARLLDEQRWTEWLDLFTPDGLYWVPLVRGQTDAVNHASLFYEDAMQRSVRARRLVQARAFSQQPPTRTVHLLGNVGLEPGDASADGLRVVGSNLLLLESRQDEQRLLGARVTHRLRAEGGGFRILLKRVDLINCDAPHEALQVFL